MVYKIMANLDSATADLIKGKNINENFAVFSYGLKSLYKANAGIQLSMNYFTLCQILSESENLNKTAMDCISKLQDFVKRVILDKNTDCVSEIDRFRNEIIRIMETFTIYMDRFQLYEYCLNRIEFKFDAGEYSNEYYNNEFESVIRNYVISERDNSIISAKMSEMIGQLPMRLSKNKFYDIISNTFSLYKGSEKSSVKDFSYMVETCGGIYSLDYDLADFEKIKEADEKYASYDYENMDREAYINATEEYAMWSSYLEEYANLYMMITEVVNALYSVCLCGDCCDEIETFILDIIKSTYSALEENSEPDVSVEMQFEKIEGMQEKLWMKIYNPEAALTDIETANYEELVKLGLMDEVDIFKKIAKLQSSSAFAKLEQEELADTADDLYVEQTANEVIESFNKAFEKCSRMTKRAIMASVLQNLPVFFNSFEDFMEYVHVSLTQCRDEAERQACMTLINLLMCGD